MWYALELLLPARPDLQTEISGMESLLGIEEMTTYRILKNWRKPVKFWILENILTLSSWWGSSLQWCKEANVYLRDKCKADHNAFVVSLLSMWLLQTMRESGIYLSILLKKLILSELGHPMLSWNFPIDWQIGKRSFVWLIFCFDTSVLFTRRTFKICICDHHDQRTLGRYELWYQMRKLMLCKGGLAGEIHINMLKKNIFSHFFDMINLSN